MRAEATAIVEELTDSQVSAYLTALADDGPCQPPESEEQGDHASTSVPRCGIKLSVRLEAGHGRRGRGYGRSRPLPPRHGKDEPLPDEEARRRSSRNARPCVTSPARGQPVIINGPRGRRRLLAQPYGFDGSSLACYRPSTVRSGWTVMRLGGRPPASCAAFWSISLQV